MLNEEFLIRMKEILGSDFSKYLESFNEKPVSGLRVNITKISDSDFKKIFPYKIVSIPYASNSYYLETNVKLGSHPFHHMGLFYLQEPSAMIPINCVEFKSNWSVLDMCAAPGGKSSEIAEKLSDGLLVSNEVNYSRVKKLYSNIERQGFNNVIITNNRPDELSEIYRNYFDLVLVDAPCSGEGMFRKNKDAILEWSLKNVTSCAIRGLEILKSASLCVKEGGYLIYSTCTFNKEENEEVVAKFLRESDYILESVPDIIKEYTKECSLKNTRKFFPHYKKGEGQFVAVLKKIKSDEKEANFDLRKNELNNNDKKIIDGFVKENLLDVSFSYKKYNNNIYISDIDIDKRIKLISNKVLMGEIKNNRLIPSHSFIMSYGKYFKNKINLEVSDERILKYLKGEELEYETNIKGYAVIMVLGNPLGLVKVVDNKLKNHYPKALRNN